MLRPDGAGDAAIQCSADRIFLAIAECFSDCDQTPSALIRSALCDLRHLCDANNLEFGACDQKAHALYLEELQGAKT